jgi:hypothetical protein
LAARAANQISAAAALAYQAQLFAETEFSMLDIANAEPDFDFLGSSQRVAAVRSALCAARSIPKPDTRPAAADIARVQKNRAPARSNAS